MLLCPQHVSDWIKVVPDRGSDHGLEVLLDQRKEQVLAKAGIEEVYWSILKHINLQEYL